MVAALYHESKSLSTRIPLVITHISPARRLRPRPLRAAREDAGLSTCG